MTDAEEERWIDEMGLRRDGWRVWWTHRGRLWRWPEWAKRTVAGVWIHIGCAVVGHDRFTYPEDSTKPGLTVCIHCSREWAQEQPAAGPTDLFLGPGKPR